MGENKRRIDGNTVVIYAAFGVLILLTIDFGIGDWKQRKISEQFYIELQGSGLIILEGIIESPSVIFVVDTSWEFMTIVLEQHQDTVYHYQEPKYPHHRSFYVFNDAMTMAWKYTPE